MVESKKGTLGGFLSFNMPNKVPIHLCTWKKLLTKFWVLFWKIEHSIIFFGNVLTFNKVTLVQHCSAQSLQICIITSTNQKDHVNRQGCLYRLVSFSSSTCTALPHTHTALFLQICFMGKLFKSISTK